ncbi:hypothetical protein EMELA_v1c03620 [Mesoplasma melaleucae]|uniref:Uncharacterized protein n=1 Tax=Mesoplasma melaleucae TaxID=81459 RepID=A0A2K8NW01_9MOLU|nr:hypothetical protein [Mesoplasma melaleucae]ATZ17924.1 hypothetical protein EMELA_v1c03620 [Mesoplasma melaleucae]
MYWIFLEKILSMMYIPILISIGFIILIGLIYWLSNKYDWPIETWSLELFKKQIIVFFTVWGINIFIILAIGFLGLYTLAWNDDFLVKLYNFSLKLLTEVMTTIIIAIGYIQLNVFGGWNMYLSFKIKSELKNQS